MPQRGFMRAQLRSLPELRSGEFNGKPWSYFEVVVLDSDANKVKVRLDQALTAGLAVGQELDMEIDTTVNNGNIKNTAVAIKVLSAAKA
jgi:hypothetical protein